MADTHANPHPALAERLRAVAPEHILHAGDVGDLDVIRRLEEIAPVTAVRGNVDGHALPDFVTVDLTRDGALLLRILLTHVAVYGPKLRADVARRARAADASLVVCGHSHVPFAARDRDITVFNPGSCGPRRFHLPILFGIIEVGPAVTLRHVECESGRDWSPAREQPPRY